jgi:hypothetical protein
MSLVSKRAMTLPFIFALINIKIQFDFFYSIIVIATIVAFPLNKKKAIDSYDNI